MPFIRQTRDKRGFEHTYVMHTYHAVTAGGPRPRVLYLFCSPANLRVGRKALDAEVMEALEHTHPDLSFDWGSISREVTTPREPDRRPPPLPRAQERPQQARHQEPPPPQAPLPDDPSALGRALGTAHAARLRRRYSELLDRVTRRARTPEERDRLLERLRRLNPDDWAEAEVIRAQAATADAALDAIAAELPSRRRGRRGGRRRAEGEREPSGIMTAGNQATDEDGHEELHTAPSAGPARADGAGGVGDAVGATTAAGRAEAAPAEAPGDPAGPEVQVGD